MGPPAPALSCPLHPVAGTKEIWANSRRRVWRLVSEPAVWLESPLCFWGAYTGLTSPPGYTAPFPQAIKSVVTPGDHSHLQDGGVTAGDPFV